MDLVPSDKERGLKTPVWEEYKLIVNHAEGHEVTAGGHGGQGAQGIYRGDMGHRGYTGGTWGTGTSILSTTGTG